MDSKRYCLYFILLLLLAAPALAGSKLEIDKVTIYIDDTQKLSTSGNSASLDVQRGDELEISVQLENLYDYDTENHMYDVDVSATLYEIDDGDDIDEEEDTTVRADRTKTVTLRLDIPSDASPYETYDLEILAEGEDMNGTMHEDSLMISIEVEREDTYEEEDEEDDDGYDYDEYMFYREQEERPKGPSSAERWEQEYQQMVSNRDVIDVVMYEENIIPISGQQAMAVLPDKEEQEGEGFSIFVLAVAIIVVVIFILILLWSWYYN